MHCFFIFLVNSIFNQIWYLPQSCTRHLQQEDLCSLLLVQIIWVGYFRVASSLCVKARLSAKPLIWKWFFLFACKWDSFSQEIFCTWPCFENESLWNSEMAYSLDIFLKLKIGNAIYSIRIHVVIYDDANFF